MDYNSYSRIVPRVTFDSKALELYMYDFMVENLSDCRGVNGYLGLVMFRLGFKVSDKIDFRNFNNDKKEDYFQCIVNDDLIFDIKFENIGNKKKHTMITLVNFNKSVTYECFPLSLSELGVRIIPVKESICYDSGVSYIREYSRENVNYTVNYLNYQLELDVVKPSDVDLPMYDNFGNYSRYRVLNEEMLVMYLSNIFSSWDDRDIVKIYRNICDISLGNELDKYKQISLKCLDNGDITDLIEIIDGELQTFGVTISKYGRTLILNKDGSWSYGITDKNDLFNYLMNVTGDKIYYNISLNGDVSTDLVSDIIKIDTLEAKNRIDTVKRLVKKIFDDNLKGSN